MKKSPVFAALGMITQFGITTITPMLLCIFAAMWLRGRFGLGDWVILAGVLMGVGSSFMSMMKMIRRMGELTREEESDEPRNEKTD